ncbi:MAG: hypothetical protein RIK87_04845 [Fuerstiella sp.]
MRSALFFALLTTCRIAVCQLPPESATPNQPTQALPVAGHAFPDGEAPQISFEIRFVSATAEMARRLEQAALVRSAPQAPELTLADVSADELTQAGGIRLVSSTSVVTQQQPVFVERLSDDNVRQWMQIVQTDARSNILMAPKVTLFNRQTAQIDDTTSRPFVVGVKPTGEAYSPQIQTFDDGTQLTLRGIVQANDSVRVDLRARFSSVEEVGLLDAGPADVTLQVPQERRKGSGFFFTPDT